MSHNDSKYSVEGCVASVLFLCLIAVVLLQVFGRFGIFEAPVWTEEVARWIWVWMAFIAIGETERQNVQLRMSIFAEMVLGKFRFYLFTLIDIIYFAVTVHLLWIGYKTVARTWNNEAVTIPVTDALMYASYPVAAVFILWRMGRRIWLQFTNPTVDDAKPSGETQ